MLGANVDAGEQLGSIVLVVSRSEAHRSARDIRSRRLDAVSRNEAAHRLEGNTRNEFFRCT